MSEDWTKKLPADAYKWVEKVIVRIFSIKFRLFGANNAEGPVSQLWTAGGWNLAYQAKCMSNNCNTYKWVVVKYFHDDFRWVVSNALRVTMNLDQVKYERLIPRGTHCLPQPLCCLTVVEKYDSSERICIQMYTPSTALSAQTLHASTGISTAQSHKNNKKWQTAKCGKTL